MCIRDSDLGEHLRRLLHPVRAQLGPGHLQGRPVGDLRRVPDRVHVRDALRDRRGDPPAVDPAVPVASFQGTGGRRALHPGEGPNHNVNRKEESMTGRKLTALSLALALTGLSLVPAAGAQTVVGVTATEVKIGHTNPYSGPASAYGTIGKTIAAYFKKVNDEGGVNGRKITFISYDDSYSPPKTVEMVRKLVEQDQVLFVFQTLGTPSNTAIHQYM